ncbi:SLATT domain-containing protein [Clostridium tarantellae]|uniref:SLATT domain-containing protein n=1 Tax=Clostridium tarantellae TaxID=39493 RepID=A0A6I1MGB3_9CLOT|nr:SLATT domain-containing protein [Clostridium tarantellae]
MKELILKVIKISKSWSLDKKILESQLRQLYADVVWGHKTQEYQANIYMRRFNFLEIVKILASTITTSGIIGSIVLDQSKTLEIITAIVSMITLFVTTYTKTYNLSELYKEFKDKSLQFLYIRERLLNLLYYLRLESADLNDLAVKRDKIVEDLKTIHMDTKAVSRRALYSVSKSLKMDDNNIYSEEEIDAVLPSILTLGKRKIEKEQLNINEVTKIEKLNVENYDEL